jgi:hypothetical protein
LDQAAIDEQLRAGGEGPLSPGQKRRDRGDLIGSPQRAQGNSRGEALRICPSTSARNKNG